MLLFEIVQYSPSLLPSYTGSANGVDEGVLIGQFGIAVLQSGAYVLEELLLWGFVAFFAVIIGSIYLFITIMRKKGGSIVDRMNQVTFRGNIENPLTSGFDILGMQTYLIIGLVTMPSMISLLIAMQIAVSLGTLSLFSLNAVYYVLLFYRFSLMAYTRIAGKTDLRIGKEEIGKKYQKRMVSWFTYLNLLLSVVLLSYTFYTYGTSIFGYFSVSLVIELRELLVAVLILPFAEGFAAVFFERFWHFWTRLRTRIRRMNLKAGFYSLVRGVLVGGACFVLFYSVLSFITAGTTFFAVFGQSQPPVFNNQVGAVDIYKWTQTAGLPYNLLVLSALWAMVGLFLFQLIKVLIGGSLTHRKNVAPEYSIIIAAITIGVLIWLIMPAANFFLGYTPVILTTNSGLQTTAFLYIPQPLAAQFYTIYYFVPAPTQLLYIVLLDLPTWIFGSLLLTYLFIFRRQLMPAKKGESVFVSSDFFKLFTSFCAVAVAAIGAIFLISPTSPLGGIVHGLLSKLWFPNASTDYFFSLIGPAFVFFHNMIRFLLTVFAPLLFWASIIGIWKAWHGERGKYTNWYILALAVLLVEGILFIDRFTFIAIIGIPIVLAALYRWFYRLLKRHKPKTMFRTTMIKISFYSLILSEIYSTALAIADRYMFLTPLPPNPPLTYLAGGNLGLLLFLLEIVPHGLVEIPAAMLAGMIGLYVARKMTVKLDENEKDLDKFMNEGVTVFWSRKVWYSILIVTIFFAIAAVIEVTVAWNIMGPLANSFGFA
jgi:uncharacterized membrane protein SpoIIM required for sporulation